MRTKHFAAILGAVLVTAGCIHTVSEKNTPGVPFLKDRIVSRYDRPVDQVFQAAKDVVLTDGTLIHEGTVYNTQTNTFKTVEGRVNQRNVWIKIEAITASPVVTELTVQARSSVGPDVDLASQLDKEIALKLSGK